MLTSARVGDLHEVELLAPLGNVTDAEKVLEAGADSLYVGLKGYSARPDEWSLDMDDIVVLNENVKRKGRSLYVAVNSELPPENEDAIVSSMEVLEGIGVDALILGDWGTLKLARESGISIPIHASTLLGVYNHRTLRLVREAGVSRVVINTNMFVDEIADLMVDADIELELLCRGICFNDCRRCALPHFIDEGDFYVGCKLKYRPVLPDGTSEFKRLFWSPDFDIRELLGFWIRLGVRCFKIEGRTQPVSVIEQCVRGLRERLDRVIESSELDDGETSGYHYILHSSQLGGAR